jgi:hypothetical protein
MASWQLINERQKSAISYFRRRFNVNGLTKQSGETYIVLFYLKKIVALWRLGSQNNAT